MSFQRLVVLAADGDVIEVIPDAPEVLQGIERCHGLS